MVPDWEGPEPSEDPTGSGGANSSGLEGQPWYLVLLELLWDYPRLLPQLPDLFQMTSMTVALDFQPQLAVWPISGESMPVKAFQEQLGISSCPPGEPNPIKPMILTSRSGYAGTLQGV